jgi:prepilin-type N-terminal cleavage/methylation domain-containing protein
MAKNNEQLGFTLVELLVVLAIVCLLSSVIFSAVVASRQKAQDAVTLSNNHILELQLVSAQVDTGGFPNPRQDTSYYVIGTTGCSVSPDGTSICDQMTLLDKYHPFVPQKSFLNNLIPTVFATTYNTGYFSTLNHLDNPLFYRCTVSSNPCPYGYAWTFYKLGGKTWYAAKAGDTSTSQI